MCGIPDSLKLELCGYLLDLYTLRVRNVEVPTGRSQLSGLESLCALISRTALENTSMGLGCSNLLVSLFLLLQHFLICESVTKEQ